MSLELQGFLMFSPSGYVAVYTITLIIITCWCLMWSPGLRQGGSRQHRVTCHHQLRPSLQHQGAERCRQPRSGGYISTAPTCSPLNQRNGARSSCLYTYMYSYEYMRLSFVVLQAVTRATPDIAHERDSSIPWWIILIAIIAALLVLVIIGVVLWKVSGGATSASCL